MQFHVSNVIDVILHGFSYDKRQHRRFLGRVGNGHTGLGCFNLFFIPLLFPRATSDSSKMTTQILLLKNATDAQIEQAVELSMRAYEGDESVVSMIGGDETLRIHMFRAMIRAGAREGAFYAVTDTMSGIILSFSIWFAPGRRIFDTEAQRSLDWTDFVNALQPKVQEWWVNVLGPLHHEAMVKYVGPEYPDSWYASIIATDPEYQRRGYASSLVSTVLQRGTKEGKPVLLATQTMGNAKWYQSLGFELKGKTTIPSDYFKFPDYILRWASC
ncbi:unnamed protein product [Cyclocybe aegerita]|uniref:N-acetyltransferase domain-containing protein n=1 Tax=Cyclocybe aegerita TaxID=1973307 RepID=A0A8S0X7U1_CYCAE|nr:unnamed protein product [Cyclocybe aegerita]